MRRPLSLDPVEVLASARESTALTDLGDDGLPARISHLVGQLDQRLDGLNRERAAAVIVGLLEERLRVLDDRKRLPIGSERIERPIIAFGEGRSGTTLLQMLLGCDPDSRLLEFWEVMRPSPPPSVSDTAVRQRLGDSDWLEILELIPSWIIAHPYNAMLGRNPPECERLWAFDFRSLPPTAWWRVQAVHFPTVQLPQDDTRQYTIHQMMLQHLQYRAPARRWVLKGVTHQHRLPALLSTYPDAIFVWIHRDPLPAIASRFELQAQIYEAISGTLDRRAFAEALVEQSAKSFVSTAEDPSADDPRIRHVLYRDFVADPVRIIRAIYDEAGLPFTDAFDSAMKGWTAANPPNRYGRFEYSVESLGTGVAALDLSLQPYRDRFGVPREH